MDIIIEGTCYHYNSDSTNSISEYITSDVRAKYNTTEIVQLDATSLSKILNDQQ